MGVSGIDMGVSGIVFVARVAFPRLTALWTGFGFFDF